MASVVDELKLVTMLEGGRGKSLEGDEVGGTMLTVPSTDEPEMMLIEKCGPEGGGTPEVATGIQPGTVTCGIPGPMTGHGKPEAWMSVTVTMLTGLEEAMGKTELLMGIDETTIGRGIDGAPAGGSTAPGVEQMVVVVATTVVDVSRTVAPAGHSAATVHNDVWTNVDVTRTTKVAVEATSRRASA
jgi:hypothetical protein